MFDKFREIVTAEGKIMIHPMWSWFWPTLVHVKRLFYLSSVTSRVYFYSPVTPDIPFLFSFRIISNSNILKTDIFNVLGAFPQSTELSVTWSHGLHLLQLKPKASLHKWSFCIMRIHMKIEMPPFIIIASFKGLIIKLSSFIGASHLQDSECESLWMAAYLDRTRHSDHTEWQTCEYGGLVEQKTAENYDQN